MFFYNETAAAETSGIWCDCITQSCTSQNMTINFRHEWYFEATWKEMKKHAEPDIGYLISVIS